jgi:hypothetical protein
MLSEPYEEPTNLRIGARVEVSTHFTGRWSDGFEVVAMDPFGCRVRRLSDGTVLPVEIDYLDVRPAPTSSTHGVGDDHHNC